MEVSSLRLPFPPEPPYAALFAERIVESAKQITGVDLDYSPDSLRHVDAIIIDFHNRGVNSESVAETLFAFGCYVGEVFRRSLGGRWSMPADSGLTPSMAALFRFMVLVLPSRFVLSPIGKVFKLCQNGDVDSTRYLFEVIRSREQNPPP